MLTVERYNVKLYFDDHGFAELPYVYGPLTTGRVYEEKFLQHVRSLGLRGEYVDVGAHLGTHAVWFAALCPATHVHAFEPVARFAGMVRRNITANGLESRVTVHQVGLSDRAGGPPTGCRGSIRSDSCRTRMRPTRASTSSASTR